MKKFLFVIFLVLLAGVIYVGVNKFAPEIESNIQGRVSDALNTALSDANITAEVNGRDVTLRGSVDNAQSREAAEKITGGVLGVRTVKNNIDVAGARVDVQQIQEEQAAIVDLSFDASENVPDMMAAPIMPETPTVVIDAAPEVTFEAPAPDAIAVEEQVQIQIPAQPEELALKVVEEDIVVTDACEAKLKALVDAEKINFGSGSATINSSSYPLLNKVVAEAKKCNNSTIQVHGFTDSSGNKATNRLLSHARAKSVGRYLLTKGVAKEVRIFGHGAAEPIASNTTEEGRAKNRRIEFKVVKK